MSSLASSSSTFIFAGGGTGGHLYPGIAIAQQLVRQSDAGEVRCIFVCSDRALDKDILSKQDAKWGGEHVILGARPLSLRPRGLARFLSSWGKSVRQSRQIIRDEVKRLAGAARDSNGRKQVHVVAMGGFVAAPVVQAARVEHVGVTLVNLDAVPGKANRLIARGAGKIFSAAALVPEIAASQAFVRWEFVPPIVRQEALAQGDAIDCRRRLGLDPDRPTLLITGGSQGARSINQLMVAIFDTQPRLVGHLRSWQVIHQCGKDDVDVLRAGYKAARLPAKVEPFVDRMSDWWGAADLAISRSGAGSVAEAWANQVPTIFLPYPHHRDQHQRHNARPLIEAEGARLVTDRIDAAKTLEELVPILEPLVQSPRELDAMRRRLAELGEANGASVIAASLLASVGRPASVG